MAYLQASERRGDALGKVHQNNYRFVDNCCIITIMLFMTCLRAPGRRVDALGKFTAPSSAICLSML